MTPLVSILIPAYNASTWISDTLDSAIAQTWPHKEIIVVDDGSTDQTFNIANRFASQGVLVVSQPNQGAAAARNHAFSLAKGDFIQWLDADDLLSADKIARQLATAVSCKSHRTLLSCSWGSFMHRSSKAKFSPTTLWCDLPAAEWFIRKWEGNHHMQTATWLVSRELSLAAGPWDTRLLGDDDGEYFARVIMRSDGIKFVPGAKVFYRVTGSNRLSYIGRSNNKITAQFLGMKLQIGYLQSILDTPRARAACVTYLQAWLIHFHPERPDILQEAQQLAASLGSSLNPPALCWKYKWLGSIFGFQAAKRAQLAYNGYKTSLLVTWDKWMSRLSQRVNGTA